MTEGISPALSATQSAAQTQMAVLALRQAAAQGGQMAALLAQQTQALSSGTPSYSNPAHLGQQIDTYA